jgi:ABC-type branched-subunit amino acid transport system permease subunit
MMRTALLTVGVILLAVVPPFLANYQIYVLTLVMINAIAAVGLNLLTGNCGQISLSNGSFMAVGAYTAAIGMSQFGLFFATALVASVVVSALLGALLGFPARRVSGLYLALITLGFLAVVEVVIEEYPAFTGGVRGLSLPGPSFAGMDLKSDLARYYIVASAAALSLFVARNLLRSRVGRAFNAVRQSAFAASAIGIEVGATKVLAFAVAAGFAGLSGGLLALVVGFIDPTEFGISTSLRHITFIIVGGLGSIPGSIIGAVVLTLVPEVLRGAKEYGDLVYGSILLASLLFMPTGLVGLASRLRTRLRGARP